MRRRWGIRLTAMGMMMLVPLLVLEMLVRLFLPHPRYIEPVVPNESVGRLYLPDYHGRSSNMFGEFDTELVTNHEGFRDTDHSVRRISGAYRIAFVGDSFTCAEQMEEPQTFVRRTEKLLSEKHSVECLNFGIGGFNTQEELLLYERYVGKYQPDAVVLMIYPDNDFIGNIFYELENHSGRPYYQMEGERLIPVAADRKKLQENYRESQKHVGVRWYHHFQAYNAFKRLSWEIRQRRRAARYQKHPPSLEELWGNQESNYRYYVVPQEPLIQHADQITRLLLRKLNTEIEAEGGKLYVALLPAYVNLYPERWGERSRLIPGLAAHPELKFDFVRPFQVVEEALPELAREGRILDLRQTMRAANDQKSIFFPRDNHYNAWGAEHVAQALSEWLAPRVKR